MLSAPNGSPCAEAFPCFEGHPNPITFLTMINVGLTASAFASSIAFEIASILFPSDTLITCHP